MKKKQCGTVDDLKKERIRRLYNKQNGKCYYCECEMKIYLNRKNGFQHNNALTVEHIYSKVDIRRYAIGGEHKIVLACFSCNNHKAERDHNSMHMSFSFEMKQYDDLLIKLLRDGESVLPTYGLSTLPGRNVESSSMYSKKNRFERGVYQNVHLNGRQSRREGKTLV